MYLLKVKGKAKIPDYIQIRDDQFVLVSYFRADRPAKNLEKLGWVDSEQSFVDIISKIPFGKLIPYTHIQDLKNDNSIYS